MVSDASRGRHYFGVPEGNPVWQSVVRYVASALIAVVVISVLGVLAFRRLGQEEAIRDAKDQTRASAFWAIDPKLIDRVLGNDRQALAELDRLVRARILTGSSVVRVKIWDQAGDIVYSDEPRLIGARYAIPPDERDEFTTSTIDAEVSDLSKPENRFERSFGKLLEVYVGLTTPSGKHVRYEEYYRSSFIDARGRRIFREFGYIALASLILLALIQLPLAWQLAHRVQRAQRERVKLLQDAVDASDRERRRIAADLHDGVVQHLAGVSYSLSAAASSAPPDLAPALNEAAAETRQGIRELRSLLVEIYPPELHRQGLEHALRDLLAPCARKGLDTSLDLDGVGELSPEVEALFFRAAQEALRNVLKHAGARHVDVNVTRENGRAMLTVHDDGQGFDPSSRPEGHFGLRLLGDLAREQGGDVRIESSPGGGTTIRVEAPA
jgi:two-component system, NarL family, sensor kinase